MQTDPPRPSSGLPILTYHAIDESGSVVSTAPRVFAQQMAWLAEQGYQTLTFAQAVRHLASGQQPPERHIVLTFDDGYLNVYAEAFPTMAQHGFTGTVFLVSDFCGRDNLWPGHIPPMGPLPLMTWPQAREMQQHGFEMAAHTRTHPNLTQVTPEQASAEIRQAKERIEAEMGHAVETLAYPYGAHNAAIQRLSAAHFLGACTTRLGWARPGHNLHALPRLDTYFLRSPALFQALSTPRLRAYLWLRQQVRDLRALLTDS